MSRYKQYLSLLVIFNILDAIFTSLSVSKFGSQIEMNPFMRWLMVVGGLPLFLAVKGGLIGNGVFYFLRKENPLAVKILTYMYALLMLWTLVVLWA